MGRKSRRKKALPVATKSTTNSSSVSVEMFKSHHGPLPSAETFNGYKQVREDLPDLIIEEWLKEGDTRRTYAVAYTRREAAKLVIVAIFSLGLLCLSGWLAYKGEYGYAVSVAVSPFAAKILGSLFVK